MAQANATNTSEYAGWIAPEQAGHIFQKARKSSVVQQLTKQVPMGAAGVAVPVTTGRLNAGWVQEGGQKPANANTTQVLTMVPRKLAVISVQSEEAYRAGGDEFLTALYDDIAEAFAQAFDRAALNDEAADGTAGGGPFSTYVAQTSKSVALGTTAASAGGLRGDLNQSLRLLTADGKDLTGFALDAAVEADLYDAADTQGRPLFNDSALVETGEGVRAGTILGRPTFLARNVAAKRPTAGTNYTVGFAGDWSQAAWGVVGTGIQYSVSTEGAVTIGGSLQSLWERNLIAIRAEAEYGFLVADPAAFVELQQEA